MSDFKRGLYGMMRVIPSASALGDEVCDRKREVEAGEQTEAEKLKNGGPFLFLALEPGAHLIQSFNHPITVQHADLE